MRFGWSRPLAFTVAFAVATVRPAADGWASESVPSGSAIGSAGRALTLAEAIDYARAHQPAVRAALARVLVARGEAEVPRAQWWPSAGAAAELFASSENNTTAMYVGPGVLDLPRVGATPSVSTGTWRPYASSLVAVGANQEIFDFGRIAAQSAAADARIAIDREALRGTELDVVFGVEEAYFAVFAAKAIVSTSQEAFERAMTHRDWAKAGVQSGLRPPIELTRSEADLVRFDVGRVKARGGLTLAQTVFAAAVGVPEGVLDAAGTPPSPAELPSLDDAIRQAESRDPELLRVLAELRAEEARTRALSAESRPDLSLTATLSGRAGKAPPSGGGALPPGGGWLPEVPNWDVGLVLRASLFDASIHARAEASRRSEGMRREEVSLAQQRRVAAVREAFAGVELARTTLPGLQKAVEAAHANYAQADARFQAGLGTSVELADAEAVRTDAEIQLALGRFELARSRARFGRTIAEGL